jgi:hypothetical protein
MPELFHIISLSVEKTEIYISQQSDYLINNKYFSQSVVNLRLEKSFNSRLFRF